jgi:hypothetical protein
MVVGVEDNGHVRVSAPHSRQKERGRSFGLDETDGGITGWLSAVTPRGGAQKCLIGSEA